MQSLALQKNLIHLAVDVDSVCIECLCDKRKFSFPKEIEQFSERLYHYKIPTIRIFSGLIKVQGKHQWGGYLAQRKTPTIREWLNRSKIDLEKGQTVFIKTHSDAFNSGKLEPYLKSRRKTSLVITGINTKACVKETLLGAVKAGFDCIVIYDRLADSHTPHANDSSPEWHLSALKSNQDLVIYTNQIKFCSAEEFLLSIKIKPASTIRPMPVALTKNLAL